MHYRPRTVLNRFAHIFAATLLGCTLATSTAWAAKSSGKKAVASASVKKKQATPTVAVRKKATIVRRTAKSAGGPKNTAIRQAAATTAAVATVAAVRTSFGQMAGLHQVADPLNLNSSVAFVMDQDTQEVLLSKNEHAVLPIASITKLMTGLLVSEAKLPLDEMITITQDDVDTEKHSRSRLSVGTTLSRQELLHLALMSSENRAAHALGRTYPGGLQEFIHLMNMKAKLLGMTETQFVEPTGLSSRNQSSARDLATLVNVAHANPALRLFSTSTGTEVEVGNRTLHFNNTNRLVHSSKWDIGLQKTGYIVEAGRCLVMQVDVAGRNLIMVFLDAVGTAARVGDAERVRNWVEGLSTTTQAKY